MKCGWGCGEQLTGRNMRAYFTICAKRPAVSGDVDRRGRSSKVKRGRRGAGASEMQLALRRPNHGEPGARALYQMPAPAGSPPGGECCAGGAAGRSITGEA
jgi:hypothetical protein